MRSPWGVLSREVIEMTGPFSRTDRRTHEQLITVGRNSREDFMALPSSCVHYVKFTAQNESLGNIGS